MSQRIKTIARLGVVEDILETAINKDGLPDEVIYDLSKVQGEVVRIKKFLSKNSLEK